METFCQLACIFVLREAAHGADALLRRSFGLAFLVDQLLRRQPISILGMDATNMQHVS